MRKGKLFENVEGILMRRKDTRKVKVAGVLRKEQIKEVLVGNVLRAVKTINHCFQRMHCSFCPHAKINALGYRTLTREINYTHHQLQETGRDLFTQQTYTSPCLSLPRKFPCRGSSRTHISIYKSSPTILKTNLQLLSFPSFLFLILLDNTSHRSCSGPSLACSTDRR